MNKHFIENSLVKELKIIRRLISKITAEQLDFRPKEGMRSNRELIQYLLNCGTGMIRYWYRTDETDFRTFFTALSTHAKSIPEQDFIAEMEEQIKLVHDLFHQISEEDLRSKVVDYPWGETDTLGSAILETCIKWLTAYKMQLFLNLKHISEEKLATADLWRKTEIES